MATYNSGALVEETLRSLLAQTLTDFELIIVDDASTDDTVERIRAFDDPRIRFIRNAHNVGVANTRNIGLDAARGEYLAPCDHDDLSLPERLEEQVRFLDAHPGILLVGAGIFTLKADRLDKDPLPPASHHLIRWMLMMRSPLVHSAICLRVDAMRRHGLRYDPKYDFGDDFDLYHRAAEVGRLAGMDRRLVKYRLHGNNASLVRGAEMHARGITLLASAHRKYLGIALPQQELEALWRVVSSGHAPHSEAEAKEVGCALTRLLDAHLAMVTHTALEKAEVEREASLLWWEVVRRARRVLGKPLNDLRASFPGLCKSRPPLLKRLRARVKDALVRR